MQVSPELVTKSRLKLQAGVGPLVNITKHFIERLFERSRDLEEFAVALKAARDILKNELCVIAYQSVVNNGVTRVNLTKYLKMVCLTDVTTMKLVIKTVY